MTTDVPYISVAGNGISRLLTLKREVEEVPVGFYVSVHDRIDGQAGYGLNTQFFCDVFPVGNNRSQTNV